MPRLPRVLYADRAAHCFIHTVDGLRFENSDLDVLKDMLEELRKEHDFVITFYQFMPNHLHFIFQFSEDVNSGKILCIIDGNLSKAYNREHDRKGHVWRERYKDVTIEEVSHFWTAFLYVAKNKKKAGIVQSLDEDIYSSWPVYAHGIDDGITTPCQDYLDLADTAAERQALIVEMADETSSAIDDPSTWDRVHNGQDVTACQGKVHFAHWLKMEQTEQKELNKRKDMAQARKKANKVLSPKAQQALQRARQKAKSLEQAAIKRLKALGIPHRALQKFWADDQFISDFVKAHPTKFGLSNLRC